LLPRLRAWAYELGFADVGVATQQLDADAGHLATWLAAGFQGSMAYMLRDATRAYIARYALGRDYHRTLRGRLKRLAERLGAEIGPSGYRVMADSAPVFEKALA